MTVRSPSDRSKRVPEKLPEHAEPACAEAQLRCASAQAALEMEPRLERPASIPYSHPGGGRRDTHLGFQILYGLIKGKPKIPVITNNFAKNASRLVPLPPSRRRVGQDADVLD